jgi:hypothetical protein
MSKLRFSIGFNIEVDASYRLGISHRQALVDRKLCVMDAKFFVTKFLFSCAWL